MKTSIKLIGVFALVLCMVLAAFAVTSEDVDADEKLSTFAGKINTYADDIGVSPIVKASVSDNKLNIDILTESDSIEDVSLDLFQPLYKFTALFGGYNNVTIGDTKVIDKGTPVNVMYFGFKVLNEVKKGIADDEVKYLSSMMIDGSEYDVVITVYISSEFRSLANVIFNDGLIDVEPEGQGQLTDVKVTVNMNDALYKIFGNKSSTEFRSLNLWQLVNSLAASDVLKNLVGESNCAYADLICEEIKSANNFTGFLADSLSLVYDNGTATVDMPAFKKVDASSTKGFRGLMETISNAMKYGYDKDEQKVSTYSELKDSNRQIGFKNIGLKMTSGYEKTKKLYDTLWTVPTVTYASKNVTVQVETSSGDSATINGSASVSAIPGNHLKLEIIPGGDRQIDSVSYYVNNQYKGSLLTIREQTFNVLFDEAGVHTIKITTEEPPVPPSTYTITVTNDGNGTASASASSAAAGTTITLTATPKEGYMFDAWESSDVTITNNTFAMPAKNVAIKATFKPIPPESFLITVTTIGSGSASADKTTAQAGETITLSQKAGTGYYFVGWDSEQVTVSDNSFTMPAENVTVTAMFDLITIYLTIEDVDNGYIVGDTAVPYGSDAAFSIVADDDYIVESLIIDGKTVAASGTHVFSKVTESHTIGATFKYVKGASTDVDEEGNTIETYTEEIEGKEVDVEKKSYVDGSSLDIAFSEDEETKVTASAVITTDSQGNVESQVMASIYADGATIISTTQLEVAQTSAKAVAAAVGITDPEEVEVVIDATTGTAKSEINISLDITKYDGTSTITFMGDKSGLSFDNDSMKGIKNKGNDIQLNLSETSILTPEQEKAAEGNKVFEITAKAGDAVITTLEGKAYLALPIDLPAGTTVDKVSIYYLADDGKVEKIQTTYEDGKAIGELTHFSKYFAAVNYSPEPEPEPSGDGLNVWLIVGIVAVVLIVVAGGAYFWFNRR